MSDVKLYTFAGAAGCYVYEGDYKKLKAENESLRQSLRDVRSIARDYLSPLAMGCIDSALGDSLYDSPENH